MSKQQPPKKQASNKPASKKAPGAANPLAGYLWRNAVVLAGVGLVFFIFYSGFSDYREFDKQNNEFRGLSTKYNAMVGEFQRLQAADPTNQLALQGKYNQIMDLKKQLDNMQNELAYKQQELYADSGYIKKLTKGYQWAVGTVAIGGMRDVHTNDSLFRAAGMANTPQQYLENKIRKRVYAYEAVLRKVKAATPDTAVILLPYGDAKLSNDSKWQFVYDPEWTEYFIYPRLCLTSTLEDRSPELAKRITHVLIVEGRGYDKLKYEVPMEIRAQIGDTVLPINPPAALNPVQ